MRGQHRSTAGGEAEPAANGPPPAQDSRLGLLTEAARAITADLTQDELLQRVADIARDVVGAHQAVISLNRGEDAAQTISAISLSDKYAAWRNYDAPPDGSGIYSIVVRRDMPMRLT